ncbi:MAG: peptidylprolyl isomerase [Proteobacteria bacterium]|nr:peptidylprolyl isomerase [Pseudomonadota bacterium]
MTTRFALTALLAATALVAGSAQAAAPKKPLTKPRAATPAPKPAPLPDVVRVALVTALGTIELDLDHKHAPITVENFVRYVDAKKFDGMPFYRAMRLDWGTQPNGLIQAGLQANPLKVFKPIAHEPTSQTGILHKAGTISMARYAPGTAMADFSILLSDLPSLDADIKSANADTQAGFAAFGHVVSGMDVVRKIWDSPLSPTKGEGPLKGQMLDPPVKVLTVRRVVVPTAPQPAP